MAREHASTATALAEQHGFTEDHFNPDVRRSAAALAALRASLDGSG